MYVLDMPQTLLLSPMVGLLGRSPPPVVNCIGSSVSRMNCLMMSRGIPSSASAFSEPKCRPAPESSIHSMLKEVLVFCLPSKAVATDASFTSFGILRDFATVPTAAHNWAAKATVGVDVTVVSSAEAVEAAEAPTGRPTRPEMAATPPDTGLAAAFAGVPLGCFPLPESLPFHLPFPLVEFSGFFVCENLQESPDLQLPNLKRKIHEIPFFSAGVMDFTSFFGRDFFFGCAARPSAVASGGAALAAAAEVEPFLPPRFLFLAPSG